MSTTHRLLHEVGHTYPARTVRTTHGRAAQPAQQRQPGRASVTQQQPPDARARTRDAAEHPFEPTIEAAGPDIDYRALRATERCAIFRQNAVAAGEYEDRSGEIRASFLREPLGEVSDSIGESADVRARTLSRLADRLH